MPQKKIVTKGFGVRYGKKVRDKYGLIENKQRKKQKCPFCEGVAKRVSNGIWKCNKCSKKFASGTYTTEGF